MAATQPALFREDVGLILAEVSAHASPRARPALLVLVGLPGSGKTRIAAELRERTGAVVLESDALRPLLFSRCTYSAKESRRLFAALHEAAETLLSEGASVVLDATNVTEAERTPLYDLAEREHAALVFALVTAPHATIRRRLARREATGADRSAAGVQVFERMRHRLEEIQRPHYTVDTSQDTADAVAAIAEEMTAR